MSHSPWRAVSSNYTENRTTSRFTSTQILTTHPQIPASINRRLLTLSSNRETIDKAKPLYNKALGSRKFSVFYNIDIKRHSLCQLSSGKIVEIHSEPFLEFTKFSTQYGKEHPKNLFYWKMHTARLWLQLLFKDAFELFGVYIEMHAHSTLWVSITSQ